MKIIKNIELRALLHGFPELREIDSLAKVPYGLDQDNEVYYTINNKRHVGVLKIYSSRKTTRVHEISKTMSFFCDKGICVPEVLGVGSLSDKRPYIWMQNIPGKQNIRYSKRKIQQIARHMARVHIIDSCKLEKDIIFSQPIIPEIPWDNVGPYLLMMREELLILNEYILGHIYPKGIIHGDYSWGNCLFSNLGKLNSVIDWDHSRQDFYIIDIARAQIFFSFDVKDNFRLEREREFIMAYSLVRPLTENEIKDLKIHIQIQMIRMLIETHYFTNTKSVSLNRFTGTQAAILPKRLDKKIKNFKTISLMRRPNNKY
ncbi:MAG: hypothetical protein COU10_03540 [Candidatus Harrisonbacteria bacterium CG10_big_fil_rev_8_21_14_0_10_45_28]|uniref:Aminoglycoside phosphotransferase domain-containing protein n=1 Tax=Candidatus Harrisonbacteria bacterium CG10_big_fil_rev_8_21_14_0_10_45_28 TaxID=1974586 RepID=A0A2H0UPP8_9BACT|nr:MAG: hypothetical protein COU10_03540 [Candidatus Harrisonbacteria bacterium CG10_big_fil_rev_8_21_14_0_10_45_28]